MRLPELMKVVIVLASLPESFEPLVVSLEGRPEGDLSLSLVQQKLIDEAFRQKEKQQYEQEKLMLTKKLNQTKKTTRTCWNCGEVGHIQHQCKHPKNENAVEGRQGTQKTNLAKVEDVKDDAVLWLTSTDRQQDG